MINGSCDFKSESLSLQGTTLLSLVSIGHLQTEIMNLVCLIASKVYLFKWSFDLMSGILSHDVSKFGVLSHCDNRDTRLLICHVILQGPAFKGSCNFMSGSPSW